MGPGEAGAAGDWAIRLIAVGRPSHRHVVMGLGGARATVLLVAAAVTAGAWLALSLIVPVLPWSARPLPNAEIYRTVPTIGPLRATTVLLVLLLVAYLGLVWVVETAPADLPLPVVAATAFVCGVCAVRTYALFAEDVHVVLASVWSAAVAGKNPYLVPPSSIPGNPYLPFTTWGGMPDVYGPAWLAVGAAVMRLLGPGVVPNVVATKGLMLVALWGSGVLAYNLVRTCGTPTPRGTAMLLVCNPLLLAEGPMTPHLDLPMAAAMLAALWAWATRRVTLAVLLLALSVAVKFITLLLVPAIVTTLGLAVATAGGIRRLRRLGWGVAALVAACAALWPGVWGPFLREGLPRSLALTSNTALLPNVLTALQAAGRLPSSFDALAAARWLRWVTFAPLWAAGTGAALEFGWSRRRDLPAALLEPLAFLLLSYHVCFTLWVLPWHLTTAICLCLVCVSRWGRVAGLLVTASGVLFYTNQWAWTYPWPDSRWIAWTLGASLLAGPVLALPLLARGASTHASAPTATPGGREVDAEFVSRRGVTCQGERA